MAQKNQGPVSLIGLQTAFIQARAGLQAQPLGKGACVAIVIQNRLTNMDNTGNSIELMVGYGTGQIYQMLPGQESPIIYCADLEDIYIRIRAAVGEVSAVDVPVFVYRMMA